jgi:hypothetical protein
VRMSRANARLARAFWLWARDGKVVEREWDGRDSYPMRALARLKVAPRVAPRAEHEYCEVFDRRVERKYCNASSAND